jgi:hypothetical protein
MDLENMGGDIISMAVIGAVSIIFLAFFLER